MTTYNPVQQLTIKERIAEFYWSNRTVCDSVMFIAVVAQTVCILVAMA